MKILLLGATGQVGQALQKTLPALGEVIALPHRAPSPEAPSASSFSYADLEDLTRLREIVRTLAPEAIVNAAAYTGVDTAESEKARAFRINAEAPSLLAEEASRLGALLVHYSTDYVYNGEGAASWREEDKPAPLNAYGESKLEGDSAIQKKAPHHLIFRTSWIHAPSGKNFIKTVLRLAAEKEQLAFVNDQTGAPTSASLLADVTTQALQATRLAPSLAGLYHLAARGETTWHGYAHTILELAQEFGLALKAHPETLTAIPASSYPSPARRPKNSRLNLEKIEKTFGLHLPSWEKGVRETVQSLTRR